MHSKDHIKNHLKMLIASSEEIVKTATVRELELSTVDGDDTANFGYTVPLGVLRVIVKLMDWWVEQIDRLLDQTPPKTKAYAHLMSIRGITYPEFKLFLDNSVSQEEFKHHRLFSFLMTVDDIHRRAYIHRLPEHQENPLSVYLDLLDSKKVPFTSFFLRTKIPLYYPIAAVCKHIYKVSQSGSGKSELMKLLFFDLQRKSKRKHQYSLALLEPHGDLVWEVLGFVMNRKQQRERVVYINPTINKKLGIKDVYSPTINIFDIPNKEEETVDAFAQEITNAISEMLVKAGTADAFSIPMDAFLKPCIATLLRKGGTDLRMLKRFMDDDNNEDLVELGKQSPDEEHRAFFQSNFRNKRYKTTKDAVYIKLQSLLNSPLFRRLTVGESTLNLSTLLNSGAVVLFDFPKSRGRKAAADFGRLMIAYIQAIALRRQDTPKKFRKQTFLFIDEFHNYIGNSIKEIMAESRKFALSLVLAHQVVGQEMSASLMDIILSNANLKIVGKNAKKSLEAMGANIDIPLDDLKKIPKYEFYVHNKDDDSPAILMKSPDFLVKKPDEYNQFFMSEEEKKDLLRYLVFESGYYKQIKPSPVPQSISNPSPPINGLLDRAPKTQDGRINHQGPISPAHDL